MLVLMNASIPPIAAPRPVDTRPSLTWAGDLLLPLRLVIGWTYFSAFWRRLVLENKLIMDAPGYTGEKFNHFLPNSFLIHSQIEFFLLRPELLWWKVVAFTIFEALVGLALLLGIATRAAGLAASVMALGILLGAGWIGTTCLDEWQIGILGIGAGLAVFFAGSGRYSLDALLQRRGFRLPRLFQWAINPGFVDCPWFGKSVISSAVGLAVLTLVTNQVFHGGVWGKFHNKSVRPKVEISHAVIDGDTLRARFYRVEGVDVYGSFAIALRVVDSAGNIRVAWSAAELAALGASQFHNYYIAKVTSGKNSLILPLGAKADVSFPNERLKDLPAGAYRIELEDISGAVWSAPVIIPTPPSQTR